MDHPSNMTFGWSINNTNRGFLCCFHFSFVSAIFSFQSLEWSLIVTLQDDDDHDELSIQPRPT